MVKNDVAAVATAVGLCAGLAGFLAGFWASNGGDGPHDTPLQPRNTEFETALRELKELRAELDEKNMRMATLSAQLKPARTPIQAQEKKPTTLFYENTQLKMAEGLLVDGERVGLWTEWHRNGQKKSEGNYYLGERWGTSRHWDDENRLEKGLYVAGKRDGPWDFYGRQEDKTITEVLYSEGRVVSSRYK